MLVPVRLPVVEMAAISVEPVVAVPVEPGFQVHMNGLVVTPLEPGRWCSSSGLAYARAPPGRARLLGLVLDLHRCSPVLNPDQV